MRTYLLPVLFAGILTVMAGVLLYQNVQLETKIAYLESPAYREFILRMYAPTPTPTPDATYTWLPYRDDVIAFRYPSLWTFGSPTIFGSENDPSFGSTVEFVSVNGGKPLYVTYYKNLDEKNRVIDRTIEEYIKKSFPPGSVVPEKVPYTDGLRIRHTPSPESEGHVLASEELYILTPNKKTIVQIRYTPAYTGIKEKDDLFSSLLASFSFKDTAPTVPAPISTPVPLPAAACGIEQCHGYDITCGDNTALMCTMEFRLEDTCRQYVRCEQKGKVCTRSTEPKFTTCVSCVQKCSTQQGTDAYDCVNRCMQ